MPRRPKPPPTILVIESLDTGLEMREKAFTDDFTGEAIPVPQDQREAKPQMSAQAIREHNRELARKDKRRLLENLGLADRVLTQAPIPKPAKPWRRV